jgi:hypothetical protein
LREKPDTFRLDGAPPEQFQRPISTFPGIFLDRIISGCRMPEIASHPALPPRERFFAWIQWQRRILVRWEYHTQNFLGFVQLACLVILFRRF